ncbi:MAG: hypothetical protein ABEJ73_06355 [Haloplanus sp.]
MPNSTLPAIDDCLDIYRRIYDHFGTAAFSPERLADALDPDARASDGRSLTHLLDLLVAYGLLERRGRERYRIRCAPDESLDRWRTVAVSRTRRLHRLVDGTVPFSDGSVSQVDDALSHGGETFASVPVDHPDDFDAVETAVVGRFDARPACAGVVLRSPGDLAAAVQRFADRLCDRGVAHRDWAFEKATTDLVGAQKNDLEFRLFLRVTT